MNILFSVLNAKSMGCLTDTYCTPKHQCRQKLLDHAMEAIDFLAVPLQLHKDHHLVQHELPIKFERMSLERPGSGIFETNVLNFGRKSLGGK